MSNFLRLWKWGSGIVQQSQQHGTLPSLALGNPCGPSTLALVPVAGTKVLLLGVLTLSMHQPIWHLDFLVFRVLLHALS
ncbi:hypothetical protein SLEP1_g40051 [Rubroshorea leprosula]|uniref:Uncharacterized protein n=1 Tax=Rubroshorea leprosula TaxID=152421 RepID=A0AAV5L2K0_9ROSI|nr:hypothetical protein SLEP1_g40051 [Rubroshorea leprosula]